MVAGKMRPAKKKPRKRVPFKVKAGDHIVVDGKGHVLIDAPSHITVWKVAKKRTSDL
jgi:hypothetical protein